MKNILFCKTILSSTSNMKLMYLYIICTKIWMFCKSLRGLKKFVDANIKLLTKVNLCQEKWRERGSHLLWTAIRRTLQGKYSFMCDLVQSHYDNINHKKYGLDKLPFGYMHLVKRSNCSLSQIRWHWIDTYYCHQFLLVANVTCPLKNIWHV